MKYPIQTQIQLCHQDMPPTTIDDEIIHVLILKESAIQNPTKFHFPHWRREGSTIVRSETYPRKCLVTELRLTRLQILIDKHQLCGGKSRLRLHMESINEMRRLVDTVTAALHDETFFGLKLERWNSLIDGICGGAKVWLVCLVGTLKLD